MDHDRRLLRPRRPSRSRQPAPETLSSPAAGGWTPSNRGRFRLLTASRPWPRTSPTSPRRKVSCTGSFAGTGGSTSGQQRRPRAGRRGRRHYGRRVAGPLPAALLRTSHGVGKWMARYRADGSLVGHGGFTRIHVDGEKVLGLGWVVRDARTGHGYATELGRAALVWAPSSTGRAGRRHHRGAQPRFRAGEPVTRSSSTT
jgi:hypothetical protein